LRYLVVVHDFKTGHFDLEMTVFAEQWQDNLLLAILQKLGGLLPL
jgi:hypothetical protein